MSDQQPPQPPQPPPPEEERVQATIGEFKGNAIIQLPVSGSTRYPFTFGFNKAKAIMEYLDDIKKFVDQEEAKKQQEEAKKQQAE